VPLARLGFAVIAGPNAGAKGECSSGVLCLTDSTGHLSWTYHSNGVVGDDTIEAFIDLNDNGKADPGEPVTSAGMHWTLPSKTVVGLGDSIAAGHGLGPSDGFPDNSNAYPMLLASLLGYAGSDYAITGACAATPGKDGGSPSTPAGCDHSVLSDELPRVTIKPNVITLTVGANDIRFGDCFKAVVLRAGDNPCQGAAFDTNLKALSQNLTTLLGRIKNKFPGVPIFMMRYYNPLPGIPSTASEICPASRVLAAIQKKNAQGYIQALISGTIGSYDTTAADVQTNLYLKAVKIVSRLNGTIETAAAAAGAKTVSPDFAGHDFCRTLTGGSVSGTWVYGPSLHGSVSGFGFINKRVPFDFDLPGVCPAPHREDSLAYYYSGTGHWDGESWEYDFTGKVNCMPHPTIDGQRGIARAFKQAIGSG
jgi:lysophospholipase L1-like esterase